MSTSEIITTKIEKTAIQTIGRLAVRLGYISQNAYEQLSMLYQFEEQSWSSAKKIFADLLNDTEIELLEVCFKEYMFVEWARRKNLISKDDANSCMQKRFNITKKQELISSLFVVTEEKIKSEDAQLIREELLTAKLIDETMYSAKPNTGKSKKNRSSLLRLSTNKIEIGTKIFSRYEVISELGQGGMGRVYKVFDQEKNKYFALKILSNMGDQQSNKRFLREANLMSQLRHPNIVNVYDIEELDNGHVFYTMDFIEGVNLSELIQKRQVSITQSVDFVRKVAEAAAYAHHHGIIHRDIKPSNIMIDRRGEPLLMDFGLAKVIEADEKISQTGAILGTPVYMAPEQAAGRLHLVNEQSDIYSIGALFYEMLTSEMPFKGSSSLVVILQVLNNEPIAPRKIRSQIPQQLENICLKAMSKEPSQRYTTGYALAEDLSNYTRGIPIVATTPSVIASWRKAIMRHKVVTLPVIFVVVFSFCFLVYSSYKEYALLFELQECTNLILNIQQAIPQSAQQRNQVTESYISIFTSHLESNDQNSGAYLGRAMCYVVLGRYNEAIQDLNHTILLAEKSPFPLDMLYLLRVQCFIECGKYKEAITDIQQIKQQDKWIWIGVIYKDFGKYDEAIKIFNKILKQHRYYQRESILFANIHKSEMLTILGKMDQAHAYAKSAVDMIPYLGGSGFISFYASAAYNALGNVSIHKKNYKEAQVHLYEASKWYPADESIQRSLALLEGHQGNKSAVEIYESLLSYSGKLHFTYYSYASYYIQIQDLEKGFSLLQKAFEEGFLDFSRLEHEPHWRNLHQHPQYIAFINKYKPQIPIIPFKFQ